MAGGRAVESLYRARLRETVIHAYEELVPRGRFPRKTLACRGPKVPRV